MRAPVWLRGFVLVVGVLVGWQAPVLAANPTNQTFTGTLTSACATFTGCTYADSAHNGSVLFANLSPPSLVSIQISGTFVGVLTVEQSTDCVNYVSPAGSFASTYTSTAQASANINTTCFQVRMSSYTSGAATVTIAVTNGITANSGIITSPLDGSGNVATSVQNTVNTTVSGTVTVTPSGGNITVVGAGAAGTPNTGVQTVQGIAGGTSLNVTCTSGCSGGTSSGTPWTYFPVPAASTCVSAACVVKSGSGVFGGFQNLSTSAQAAGNCIWYDSNSTSPGSAQVLYIETTIGAGQVITEPYPGVTFSTGLAVQCAVNPTGSGLLVFYR